MSTTSAVVDRGLKDARGRPYQPAVSPRLKVLLVFIFIATALLALTGVYLLAVRLLEWYRVQIYTNLFALWMFVLHVLGGVVLVLPFVYFGVAHWLTARHRPNRRAVRLGIALFATGILVIVTGLLLIQLDRLPQLPSGSVARWIIYGLHLATPVAAVVLYVLHRLAGPDIQWGYAKAWGAGVGAFVAVMAVLHVQDPRKWYAQGPREGALYFEPSKSRTATGDFIPAESLMMEDYCIKCHRDIGNDWFHSAHHFSSFNNPPYRFSVRETRKMGMERDGHTRASRWCAGCHDPVPFFSGGFDDPLFDDVNHPTSQAGITCTVCHAMTHINSTAGNGDYTIEEPLHYPFAYSKNPVLQWINLQVVKAKPDFHKQTFLKPFHKSATDKSAEFCSTCHKVSLPVELNHYKEFLRGQNHYDSYLLSGVSGHGARAFYYPPVAKTNCSDCHMPLKKSDDFGSKDFDGTGTRKVHSHAFPGANTGLPFLLSLDPLHAASAEALRKAGERQADFLRGTDPEGKDKKVRIDIFGIKQGGTIDGQLSVVRPQLPVLKPGGRYLVEVVVRTLAVGHPFTQGTVDSNEVWVDFTAKAGNRVIGRSGALAHPDENGPLDDWAHRINVLLLDRHGNRINRRNPQDIFTPLYDHQVPPGAAQIVHYDLQVPADVEGPIELSAKVRYRKFDFEYMALVHGGADKVPRLPIADVCADEVLLPVAGGQNVAEQKSPIDPPWQRWNDYGIACFVEGGVGAKRGEFAQAEKAFKKLLELGAAPAKAHAHLNLARVYFDEGRLAEAAQQLDEAKNADPPAPWWTVAWFNGLVTVENAKDKEDFDAAIAHFERILDPMNQPRERKFDFSLDYVVINRLANTLFKRSQLEAEPPQRDRFLSRAIERYETTLKLDAEDLEAHFGLNQCYTRLGLAAPHVAIEETDATDEASLAAASAELRDAGSPKDRRLLAAARLARSLTALGKEPVRSDKPKRIRFELMRVQMRTFFAGETDPELQAAAAWVLGHVHRELHSILKPDDIARARAVGRYRQKNPAADHAAEAILIYPLNRPGAPGL